MTSLQQKLDKPTFTNLQNTIFNYKEKTFLQYQNTQIKKLKHLISRPTTTTSKKGLQNNQHFQHCCHIFYFLKYLGQVG